MIDQNDLAAGPEHARKFVERRMRIGNGRDQILADDDVEACIGKAERRGVHHRQPGHMIETLGADALLRLAQHRQRNSMPETRSLRR